MIGGGGNRTPVPRRVQASFYVRSRLFASRVGHVNRHASAQLQPSFSFAAATPGGSRWLAHCRRFAK